ncbi:MAG TPA: hypothetical protein VMB03_24005 [Bryobacteraceae bacterium]|nr:hypothetical protein [Bryobacteraceae bacterium]
MKTPSLKRRRAVRPPAGASRWLKLAFAMAAFAAVGAGALMAEYTVSLRSPVRVHWQWPVVIARRMYDQETSEAQADQSGRRLTAFQQYACNKFGEACRVALAVQRAENPRGECEIYHYNSDGTLDWGYFQINTVHLKRKGVNLRGLLDCKANIDFAYQLYSERGFEPWTTFRDGTYRQFLRSF